MKICAKSANNKDVFGILSNIHDEIFCESIYQPKTAPS